MGLEKFGSKDSNNQRSFRYIRYLRNYVWAEFFQIFKNLCRTFAGFGGINFAGSQDYVFTAVAGVFENISHGNRLFHIDVLYHWITNWVTGTPVKFLIKTRTM